MRMKSNLIIAGVILMLYLVMSEAYDGHVVAVLPFEPSVRLLRQVSSFENRLNAVLCLRIGPRRGRSASSAWPRTGTSPATTCESARWCALLAAGRGAGRGRG